MEYNEYIKEKLINIYLKKEKVGFCKVNNKSFNFLDEITDSVKINNYSLSTALLNLVTELDNNKKLKNLIGLDFLSDLRKLTNKKVFNEFSKEVPLNALSITSIQKEKIEENYTKIANDYGLKEFYYTLNPELSPPQNYNKSVLLLNKTKKELQKLQKSLNIKDSTKVGNNILSIQVNWQEDPSNEGYYNFCSNTICLKDESSTFPLVHEYIHFIDKTATALILTGKTTQELYEENLINQKDLFHNFDMSIFSKIEFKKENFPWIDTVKLKLLFGEEINKNKYIQSIFNKKGSNKNYRKEFNGIILDYIEKSNFPNKKQLAHDFKEIVKSKKTFFESNFYIEEEKEIIKTALVFNTFSSAKNNVQNWSENYDFNRSSPYYLSQKEMLARTLEQVVNGKLDTLSDKLTTPKLSDNEKTEFFNIIKSWHQISEGIILARDEKNNVTDRIKSIRAKQNQIPDLVTRLSI